MKFNEKAVQVAANLRYYVLSSDVDEKILTPEVLKLRRRYANDGTRNFYITLGDTFTGTEEDAARELNLLDERMKDPATNLIGRLEGHLWGKRDYIGCTENRTQVLPGGVFHPMPPSDIEKMKITGYRDDIRLIQEAIDLIKNLSGGIND